MFFTDLCTVNKTTTRTATIFFDKNDILHIEMFDGIRVDYEDMIDNALVIKRLTSETRFLKLIDARANFSIDKKAREFINALDAKQTIAQAVLKGSAFRRVLFCIFISLHKSKTPVKIFSDYDEAYNWLMSYKRPK